jgi:photosystem II stability/assembly factor-like uncharacterized protein
MRMRIIRLTCSCFAVCQIVETTFAQVDFWIPTGGPTSGVVNSLAVDSSNHVYAGTSSGGVFCSSDMGITWTQCSSGLPNTNVVSLAVNHHGHLFAIVGGVGVFRSTDAGAAWTASLLSGWVTHHIALSPTDQIYVPLGTLGYYGYLLRSNDNGISWQDTLSSFYVPFVAVNASGHIFATFSLGTLFRRSTDSGLTWSGILLQNSYAECLAFGLPGQIFMARGSLYGMSRSSNNGDTWTTINDGLTNLNMSGVIRNRIGTVFCGSSSGGGCFYSTNNGDTWIENNSGLTNLRLLSMAIDSNGLLYVGTNGNGVFRSRVSTTDARLSDNPLPSSFSLGQNFPNPFNSTTHIAFRVSRASFVTLKIFDMLGGEIATLVSEVLPFGEYSRQWNADGIPSGIYFYRLQAGPYSATRKLVLLR